VSQAAATGHLETSTGLDNRKLLMWLFLSSECLFFGSLIAAYLLYRDSSVTGPYPDELFDIPFTSVSAFQLLVSSVTMVLALAAIQRGNVRAMQIWIAIRLGPGLRVYAVLSRGPYAGNEPLRDDVLRPDWIPWCTRYSRHPYTDVPICGFAPGAHPEERQSQRGTRGALLAFR